VLFQANPEKRAAGKCPAAIFFAVKVLSLLPSLETTAELKSNLHSEINLARPARPEHRRIADNLRRSGRFSER
jgi:hypothetical protein